ncbi:MAG TPA: hypothetical protein DDZ81_11155 [Acetobacteraceae bacterium]|jgi:hypothetical protein|nr:hypothetical protein [Acetobacteraceae bacterium]
MRLYHVAAVGFLIALPALRAHAAWEYTEWGMTPEQVVNASHGSVKLLPPNEQQKNDEMKMITKVGGDYTDGDLHVHIKFGFSTLTDKLEMVGYEVTDPKQNDLLIAWLTKKYGPPAQKSGIETIGYHTYAWEQPDDIMLGITKGTAAFVMQSQLR